MLGRVEQAIRDLLARGRGRRTRLRAVAIASYGRVDVERGRVLAIGNVFNWTDVPVRERLAPVFRVPVFVDNDVNMAALGELRHGAAAGERDFVLIHLKTGIGCGVVLGGKLHHGAHWAAGEIAHTVVAESAACEDWRERGYLEHVLSEDRLIERIRRAGIGGDGDALAALVDAAAAGDAQARRIMDQVTTHLGVAVAATAAAYDPAVVVLHGRLFELLYEQVGALIRRVIPWGVKLSLSTLGDEAILLGTVIAARSLAYERIALELNT